MGCRDLHHLAQEGAALLAQQWFGQRQQRLEARITALVDGVAEAGNNTSVAQHIVEGACRAVALRHGQQLVGLLAGAAVQRPGQGDQPSQKGVVGIGAHRGGDAYGHGRCGQLVVGQKHEGRVHRCFGQGRCRPRQAPGEPGRDACGLVLTRRGRTDHLDQRRRRPSGRARHRVRPPIRAQRIVRTADHQGPAHAVERGQERTGTEIGCQPVATTSVDDAALDGLPQQLRHVLEAPHPRQLGSQPSPVERAELLVELGHTGRDGGHPGGRLAPTPAARPRPPRRARGRRGCPGGQGPDGTRGAPGSRRRTGWKPSPRAAEPPPRSSACDPLP